MNISTLLIKTSLIFYILAVIFFCAFCVVLLFYILNQKKDKGNFQSKSWTIESAKKFLENNNIDVKESSNEKVVNAKKSEIQGKVSNQIKASNSNSQNKENTLQDATKKVNSPVSKQEEKSTTAPKASLENKAKKDN